VGVHYVGEMYRGSRYRTLLDFVTDGHVDWSAMPERYDRFIYPDLTFDARSGAARLREDLIARFPHERGAIERYFEDVVSAARKRWTILRLLIDSGRRSTLQRQQET